MRISLVKMSLVMFGALFIIAGLVLQSLLSQLVTPEPDWGRYLSLATTILGWLIVAFATISRGKTKFSVDFYDPQVYLILFCIALIATLTALPQMEWSPIVIAVAWVMFGYIVGQRGGQPILGVVAAALALVAQLWAYQWEHLHRVVMGPGLPLTMMAWALLAVLNGRRGHVAIVHIGQVLTRMMRRR